MLSFSFFHTVVYHIFFSFTMQKALFLQMLFLAFQITPAEAGCDLGTCGLGQFFQTSSNTCIPCPIGMFMDQPNHRCLACSPCRNPDEGTPEILIENCTSTTDAVIGCPSGYKRVNYLCKKSKSVCIKLFFLYFFFF